MSRRLPRMTGEERLWSRDLWTQRTFGDCGPGWPSVFPVRCGLPRKVAHGSDFCAPAGAARNAVNRTDATMRIMDTLMHWFSRLRLSGWQCAPAKPQAGNYFALAVAGGSP